MTFRRYILPLLCLLLPCWTAAQNTHYEVTHEGRKVNTVGSETGAVLIGDTLYYSSLQQVNESGGYIDFGLSLMRVYQAPRSANGKLGNGTLCDFGINHPTRHSGNFAFDSRNDIIYFTRCNADDDLLYLCEIYSMQRTNGVWSKPKKLSGDINLKGYNSTQPAVGYLPDGSTILYFSSNRPGGSGGMDIWYSVITETGPAPATNLGAPVNSPDDEISPFYEQSSGTLYFSSNRADGIGGYDIYSAKGSRNSWRTPRLMPEPLNSIENDIYFTVSSDNPTEGYLSSNRSDSYFLYDTSCCYDIYHWESFVSVPHRDTVRRDTVAAVPDTCPCRKARLLLPIRLFFHNDEPNPRSLDTVSSLTYFQTYNQYMFLRSRYRSEYNAITDSLEREMQLATLESFFNEVQYNCEKFEHFIHLLAQDILDGRHVVLTVGGYASPLHSSQYNVNLSKRRISTIINQLKDYDNGVLRRIMDQPGSGSLEIEEAPYGSSTSPKDVSNDARDQLHSVYSVEAAHERRIEILQYRYQ